jgi:hypothetical protein
MVQTLEILIPCCIYENVVGAFIENNVIVDTISKVSLTQLNYPDKAKPAMNRSYLLALDSLSMHGYFHNTFMV